VASINIYIFVWFSQRQVVLVDEVSGREAGMVRMDTVPV